MTPPSRRTQHAELSIGAHAQQSAESEASSRVRGNCVRPGLRRESPSRGNRADAAGTPCIVDRLSNRRDTDTTRLHMLESSSAQARATASDQSVNPRQAASCVQVIPRHWSGPFLSRLCRQRCCSAAQQARELARSREGRSGERDRRVVPLGSALLQTSREVARGSNSRLTPTSSPLTTAAKSRVLSPWRA